MLYLWICLSVVIEKCLGFSDMSFRSSVMAGEKPILRMGPEMDEIEGENPAATTTLPKEPDWVTNLRSNLKKAVREEGFEDAKPELKHMIDEADEEVNGAQTYHIPAEVFSPRKPLRARPPKRYVPQWERELIAYVRNLIQQYGKKISLDSYVQPVVDLNAYGQIIVTYDSLSKNEGRSSGLYPQPPPGQYGITGY